jgi:hypothetical protein
MTIDPSAGMKPPDPKPPKSHHILPQRYQAGFAGIDERVWCFDRRTGTIVCGHPKRVAVENHFYTYEPRNSPNATDIESFLGSHVEGPFWPVLDRLENQEIPTPEDRLRMSFFAAFMLTRIPAFRDFCAGVFANTILSSPKLASNLQFLGGILRATSGGVLQPTEPKNSILVRMQKLGVEIGKHLLTLDTHLMYSPADEPFISGDNPFVLMRMVNDAQPPTVSATSFMKWIPLSAKVALGFGLPGNRITLTRVECAKVRKINIGLATASRQIVLARSREQLERILLAVPKVLPGDAGGFPSVVL